MGVTQVTTAQLSSLRALSSTGIKAAVAKRLRAAGQVVAADARARAGAFSSRIPASVKVTGGTTMVYIVAGGDTAPNAYPFEYGKDHPVFATGDRSTWHWGKTPKRPFLEEAADATAELAAEEFAQVVDDWCAMLGLSDLSKQVVRRQCNGNSLAGRGVYVRYRRDDRGAGQGYQDPYRVYPPVTFGRN